MKMNKIRVAKATVNGKESLILITLDPDGRKMCMTMAELDDDDMTEVIVTDDGFIVSKDEVGYEDHEEEFKEMFEKLELGETCTISPTSHSCSIHTLALQLINKFSLKTRLNKLNCLVKMLKCGIVSLHLHLIIQSFIHDCISLNILRLRQNKHKTAEL